MSHFTCLVLLLLVPLATCNYVLLEPQHLHLSVPIGRRLHFTPADLGLSPGLPANHSCVLELILGEAVAQRVGRFQPEVISCDFQNGSAFYSHFGSRMLNVDVVRLRVIREPALGKQLEVQPLELHVHIQLNVPYKSVSVVNHLLVPAFFGVSQPLDSRVLEFHRTCRVTVRVAGVDSKWPKYGQLIHGRNRTLVDAPMAESCEVFPHLNLRYEHLSPPTPEVDHIELLIESIDDHCPSCLHQEWLQLKVVIHTAKPNFPPKISPHATLQLSSGLHEPEVVVPAVLFAVDNETASANLLFNLTQPPQHGYFHFLSFPTKPLLSFMQRDIIDRRLAFTGTKTGSEIVNLHVLDELFASTVQPAALSVTVSDNGKGEVSVVSGLIVFEGKSTSVSSHNIQLKRKKTNEQPRISFQVLSGPRNGNLSANRGPLKFFYWYDVEWGLLSYSHDGSDTSADEVMVGVGQQRLKLPITVVASDDSPPQLVVNRGLTVNEGRTLVLTADDLNAVDPDTTNEDITYHVVRPPQGGYLLKRLLLRPGFLQLTNFTQNDIDQGLIVYTHANSQLFFDEFQIVLKDDNYPVPNESPEYDVSVVINPLVNDPPRPMVTASFRAVVKETEVLHLNRNLLGYINKAAREDDIYFNLTSALHPSYGKLVLTSSAGSKEQLEQGPAITSFSQLQVNRKQVVYVPPAQDIGPHLLEVRISFAAQDGLGHTAPNNMFFIQVLPVDNKKPQLRVKHLSVGRGQSTVLSPVHLQVSDEDTEDDDMTWTVLNKASHGTFLFDDAPLHVTDTFTLKDIWDTRISYLHRGYNLKKDALRVSVSDGRNEPTVGVIDIVVSEANMTAAMTDQTSSSDHLVVSVLEKDFITIPTELLSSESGSAQSNVHYAIVKSPHHGSVYVRGRRSNTFSQKELENGEVTYIHDGNEIGYEPQIDDLWITVNDGVNRARSADETVQTLKINILPVDNVAPKVNAGRALVLTEGGSAPITTHNILLQDNDSVPEHIILVVSKPPLYGVVQVNGKKVKHFRLSQLISGQVKYTQTHHRYLEQRWDSMIVYATDGYHRSDSVKIDANITLINDELPMVTIHNISMLQRASKILDRSVLAIADLDWPSDPIVLTLVTQPLYGRLVITHGQTRPTEYFSTASLVDWEKHPVQYSHTASHAKPDFFTLSINDGAHQVLATIGVNISVNQTQPLKLPSVGPPIKIGPPVKIDIVSPETLEEFSDGFYGFIFTRHLLKVSSSKTELLFKITAKPFNGQLENLLTGQKDISTFEMKDLVNEHIRYTIVNAQSAQDRFNFSIDNSNLSHMMSMEWSVIYFPKSSLKVCEDVGVMSVTVMRSSNLAKSSFVSVRTQAGSATEGADYKPSRVKSLQFHSGVSSLSWDVGITSDEPDRELVETFTVHLHQAVNAVLLPDKSICTVQIVDQRRGGCGKEDETSFTPSITDTVTNPQECTKRNSGQKLHINYGSTKISLLCDGSAWKPVPN